MRPSPARLGLGGLIAARLERPERGERMLFARLPQWEEAPSGRRRDDLVSAAMRGSGSPS